MDENTPWYERRHLPPDARALEWVRGTVDPDGTLDGVEFLPGGSSSAIHRVTVRGADGTVTPVVLRRWIRPDWRETEGYLSPEREATVLRLAERHGIPAPRLLALDASGSATGLPALLMSHVPGGPCPTDPPGPSELGSLAEAIAAVHRVRLGDELPAYHFYNRRLEDTPPSAASDKELWSEAFALGRDPGGRDLAPKVFVHRDFNPGNILWTDHRVSGMVDWGSAAVGVAAFDLGHMRWNLAVVYDVPTADAFLTRYRAAVPSYVHDPFWDLRAVLDLFPESPSHTFSPEVCAKLEHYLRGVVAAMR
ncbi:phosphotransferase family protein [Micromonospora sp. NPDC050187]|uniref:phosphotransferase family protein n=1 Tax=Micromonospora sp. NPDC050187 TaxID=3364277 RepID=UPI00378F7D4B